MRHPHDSIGEVQGIDSRVSLLQVFDRARQVDTSNPRSIENGVRRLNISSKVICATQIHLETPFVIYPTPTGFVTLNPAESQEDFAGVVAGEFSGFSTLDPDELDDDLGYDWREQCRTYGDPYLIICAKIGLGPFVDKTNEYVDELSYDLSALVPVTVARSPFSYVEQWAYMRGDSGRVGAVNPTAADVADEVKRAEEMVRSEDETALEQYIQGEINDSTSTDDAPTIHELREIRIAAKVRKGEVIYGVNSDNLVQGRNEVKDSAFIGTYLGTVFRPKPTRDGKESGKARPYLAFGIEEFIHVNEQSRESVTAGVDSSDQTTLYVPLSRKGKPSVYDIRDTTAEEEA